jgi:hypothetical protein
VWQGPETRRAGQFTVQDTPNNIIPTECDQAASNFFLFKTFFIVGPKNESSLLSLDSNTDCTSPERGNAAILILLLQERTMVHAVFSFNKNTLFST